MVVMKVGEECLMSCYNVAVWSALDRQMEAQKFTAVFEVMGASWEESVPWVSDE